MCTCKYVYVHLLYRIFLCSLYFSSCIISCSPHLHMLNFNLCDLKKLNVFKLVFICLFVLSNMKHLSWISFWLGILKHISGWVTKALVIQYNHWMLESNSEINSAQANLILRLALVIKAYFCGSLRNCTKLAFWCML